MQNLKTDNNEARSYDKLVNLVEYKKGKKPLSLVPNPQSGYVPYIDIEAFEKGIINRYTNDKNAPLSDKDKDILVVWDGARAGLVGKASGVVGSTLMRLTPKDINRDYLSFFLSSKYREISTNHRGTGIPHVNPDIFWGFEVPIPSLDEQHIIATKISHLIPLIEQNKLKLANAKRLVAKFRLAILSAAVTGKLTEDWRENNEDKLPVIKTTFTPADNFNYDIPQSWVLTALGNYATCSRGRFSIRPRNDPRYFGGKYPFIQIGDLPKDGGLITKHTQTLNDDGLRVSKLFNKGTVVIAIVGATIGNTGILDYDMCFPDSLVGIDSGQDYGNKYIEYYLRVQKQVVRQQSYASGGQPNINLEVINNYPLPLPPVDEQREIVQRVNKFFDVTNQVEKQIEKAEARVSKLTQAILAKTFNQE